MKIKINQQTKLKDIQTEFQKSFPNLSLEFYAHVHQEEEGSKKKDTLDKDLTIHEISPNIPDASLDIKGNMPVADLEAELAEILGFGAQVFRKSGNVWLQTTATDHLTLDEQNLKAKERETLGENDEEIPDAMDRQELE